MAVGKRRRRTIGLEEQSLNSALREFRVNYELFKYRAIGKSICSEPFSTGGLMWRVNCYPSGRDGSHGGEYVSIFFELVSKSKSVHAIYEAFLIDKDRQPCHEVAYRSNAHLFETGSERGWSQFVARTELEEVYLTEGHFTFVCAIMVIRDSSIPVPPPDIGEQFSNLLDSSDGADISFVVDGETFHAHRAVLAARSLVFRAELLGSMAEATMSSITLHEITPATFRIMLQFVYTDALPGDDELWDSSTEMMQNLLAAADRYALDRLKLMCAQKLWDDVSVDTVTDTLACAKMYSCSELKSKCFDFFASEENFKKAVLTEGFVQLVQKFPSIMSELRERLGI
ncbi:hypothetical protein EJB05_48143, partial [Eragrostis curvula]